MAAPGSAGPISKFGHRRSNKWDQVAKPETGRYCLNSIRPLLGHPCWKRSCLLWPSCSRNDGTFSKHVEDGAASLFTTCRRRARECRPPQLEGFCYVMTMATAATACGVVYSTVQRTAMTSSKLCYSSTFLPSSAVAEGITNKRGAGNSGSVPIPSSRPTVPAPWQATIDKFDIHDSWKGRDDMCVCLGTHGIMLSGLSE